jgi:predicted nucleic acid-binding protein
VIDCFDADVLIYAAIADHPLGQKVADLLTADQTDTGSSAGSVLLLPEVLGKPLRDGSTDEVRILAGLLARLDLCPLDRSVAEIATALSAKYGLHAADATHLATAVGLNADRFITNNRRDFPVTISEIDIVYPANLP